VTVEEGAIMGGAGSAVAEALAHAGVCKPLLQLGLGDVFTEHGDPASLLAQQGLDAGGMESAIRARFDPVPASGNAAKPALKSVG
jgi:1-deoxy-D-xylulose-5-phosphate synthase